MDAVVGANWCIFQDLGEWAVEGTAGLDMFPRKVHQPMDNIIFFILNLY